MDSFSIAIPIISHITAALYLQKQKYNKFVTACFWTIYAALSVCVMYFIKNPLYTFFGLLIMHYVIFCITTIGSIGEKTFLLLVYSNLFSITVVINMVLSAFIFHNFLLCTTTIAVFTIMHLYLNRFFLIKHKKAKKYFISGWWKLNIILMLFLVQFLNQYAFSIQDPDISKELLLNFVIFSTIFNTILILIFDSVMNISEKNKKTYENDKLKNIAYTDALTNMKNRFAYMSFTKQLRCNRQKNDTDSYVFAMLDIDNFKSINDTQGHAKGDETLEIVSAIITDYFKDMNCHSFRIGGDEFVLLLENIDISQVEEQITKLNKKLFKTNRVTISFGCSQVDFNHDKPFETAYKKADAIMYLNKQQKNVLV